MKKLFFLTVSLFVFQTFTFSQYNSYNNNGKEKIIAEKVTLTIEKTLTDLTPEKQSAGLLVAAGTILPPLIDLTTKSVKRKVKKNSLAYQGEYTCKTSGSGFYTIDSNCFMPKLIVKRIIKRKNGRDTLAAKIEIVPELASNSTAFRYFVKDSCRYNYSIAKTKGKYDFIALRIEIEFKSLSVKNNEYKFNDLRTTFIDIPIIDVGLEESLDEKYYSGWIPLPPRSNAKNLRDSTNVKEVKTVEKTNSNGEKGKTIQETVTTKYNQKHFENLQKDDGLYEIKITVKETNPYRVKAENKNEIVESSGDSVGEFLKAIVSSSTNTKDDTE